MVTPEWWGSIGSVAESAVRWGHAVSDHLRVLRFPRHAGQPDDGVHSRHPGAERQYRQRTAGLRTNVLVAVGAAAFVDLAMHLAGADGAVRVIAYVVSGIGFLGAGVIMKQGMDVRGLNTAATLWASAAVGSCAGADMVAQAVALTVFVLAGNTLLRPLVNAINRIPLDEQASEATYYFKLAVTPEALPDMRDHLVERLEAANIRSPMSTLSRPATICWRSSRRWSRPRSIPTNSMRWWSTAAPARRAPCHLGSKHQGLVPRSALIPRRCVRGEPCFARPVDIANNFAVNDMSADHSRTRSTDVIFCLRPR